MDFHSIIHITNIDCLLGVRLLRVVFKLFPERWGGINQKERGGQESVPNIGNRKY